MSRSRKKNITSLWTDEQDSSAMRTQSYWRRVESKATHNRKFVNRFLRSNKNNDFEDCEENLHEIKYNDWCKATYSKRTYGKKDIISQVTKFSNELRCIDYTHYAGQTKEKIDICENSFEFVPFKQQHKNIILNFIYTHRLYPKKYYWKGLAEEECAYIFSNAMISFFPVKSIIRNEAMFEHFYDANKLTKFLKRK